MNQDILMLQLRYATEQHRCTFFYNDLWYRCWSGCEEN